MGDRVTAICVELALFSLFELLDEIDDSAATSTEEFAVKESSVSRARLVLAGHWGLPRVVDKVVDAH